MAIPISTDAPDLDVTAAQRQIGALEIGLVEQFTSIRELGTSTDATFSFGLRASRPASGLAGDRFLAVDRNCLFYYTGTAWAVVVGFFSGTNATRSGMTVDATDNGFFFFTNNDNKLWVVSSGAWVDLFVTLDATTSYEVNNVKVVGARKTGWTPATGTAARTTFATFAGQTITNPPTQAEVQAIDDHMKVLSQRMKALIDDLHATAGHGMIGT